MLFNERVDYNIVTLERIESRHRLRLTAHRGSLLPWPATANEERDEGILGVAVPIAPTPYTHRCLSIVAPKFRVLPDVFERMRHALLISAQTLRRHHH